MKLVAARAAAGETNASISSSRKARTAHRASTSDVPLQGRSSSGGLGSGLGDVAEERRSSFGEADFAARRSNSLSDVPDMSTPHSTAPPTFKKRCVQPTPDTRHPTTDN